MSKIKIEKRFSKLQTKITFITFVITLIGFMPYWDSYFGFDSLEWLNNQSTFVVFTIILVPLAIIMLSIIFLMPSNKEVQGSIRTETIDEEIKRDFFRDKAIEGMIMYRFVQKPAKSISDNILNSLKRYSLEDHNRSEIIELTRGRDQFYYDGYSYKIFGGDRFSTNKARYKNALTILKDQNFFTDAVPIKIRDSFGFEIDIEGRLYRMQFSKKSMGILQNAKEEYAITLYGESSILGYACKDWVEASNLYGKTLFLFSPEVSEYDRIILFMIFYHGKYATSSLLVRNYKEI